MELFPDPPEKQAEEILDCDGQPFGHDVARLLCQGFELTDPALRAKIRDIKVGIATLQASTHAVHNEACDRLDALFAAYEQETANNTLDVKYRINNVMDWIGKSSYRDISELCVWNVGRHGDLQQALREHQEEMDERTMELTKRLVDINLFPKKAIKRTEMAIGAYGAFQAIDTFESAASATNGWCDDDSMALANLFIDHANNALAGNLMHKVAFHERMHGTGSGRAGFFDGITKRHMLRWLEESAVEHASVVAFSEHPHVDILSPFERPFEHGQPSDFYQDERVFLGDVIAESAANIPVDLLYEAFFSGRGTKSRKEVESRLTSFFVEVNQGDNEAMYTFSDQYEQARKSGACSKVVQAMTKKILTYQGIVYLSDDDMVS